MISSTYKRAHERSHVCMKVYGTWLMGAKLTSLILLPSGTMLVQVRVVLDPLRTTASFPRRLVVTLEYHCIVNHLGIYGSASDALPITFDAWDIVLRLLNGHVQFVGANSRAVRTVCCSVFMAL